MYNKSVALAAAAACAITMHSAAFAYQTSTSVSGDDTFKSLSNISNVTKLPGQDYGYSPYSYSKSANGAAEAIDARLASFLVDNSSVSTPTAGARCDSGSGKMNVYPVKIYNSDKTAFVGGLVRSAVPQTADWQHAYCNSAVVLTKYAKNATVDGTRITGAWDGLRFTSSSPDFTVKNVWASGVRDDFVENDSYYAGGIYDSLVDGAFQFLSMQGSSSTTYPSRVVQVRGNVIRLKSMLYKGSMRWGSLLKGETYSPQMSVHNTVLAVDPGSGTNLSANNWSAGWNRMTSCSNNLLLWMSDNPIPSSVGKIKSCFTVLKGSAARAKWAEVKQNWINCHPQVRRESTDPAPRAGECRVNTFGGYNS